MILDLQNINKSYGEGKLEVPVLFDIDLQVEAGEYVAIMGPSGSGKSTLMNIIGCLDVPTSGTYILDGENISGKTDAELSALRNRTIGFVFQNFNLLPRESALDNVALPMLYAGVHRRERMERARKALERVGLGDRLHFKPTQLSGGQKQRVAIAGVIAMRPRCIVLDEPTAMLDPIGREEVIDTIQKLNREFGVTVVLITHHMDEAARADRLIVMDQGQVIADGAPRTVFQNVEGLRSVGLTVPETVGLLYELRQAGLNVPLDALSVDECAQVIAKALKEPSDEIGEPIGTDH